MLSGVEPLPASVQRAEDVTAEHLGGASEAEVSAFRMATLQTVLNLEIAERTAILLIYGGGDGWRERVADIIPVGWGLLAGTIARQPGVGPVERNSTAPGAPR
jgi:hypothetical protein